MSFEHLYGKRWRLFSSMSSCYIHTLFKKSEILVSSIGWIPCKSGTEARKRMLSSCSCRPLRTIIFWNTRLSRVHTFASVIPDENVLNLFTSIKIYQCVISKTCHE